MSDISSITKWLLECANYFEDRPTGGEDQAHWANVWNAENARKAAAALTAAEKQIAELREARQRWREDAGARLLNYVALLNTGLLGSREQITVALMFPTLAMLDADASSKYDWTDADAVDVDAAIAAARRAYKESEPK